MKNNKANEMSDEELYEELSRLRSQDERDFEINMSVLKEKATQTKKKFLSLEPFEIKNQPNFRNANDLLEIYCDLMFFPNEDVYKKFEEFGYRKNQLTWFLHINQILEEIVRIETNGDIFVWRNKLIEAIRFYYICQANIDVHIWAGQYKEKKYQEKKGKNLKQESKSELKKISLVHDMEKITKRMMYGDGVLKKINGTKDHFLAQVITEFSALEKELHFKKESLFKLIKGQKPKFFLSDIINNCFLSGKRKSEPDYFLSSLYNLFRMIIKTDLPDTEEIEDSGKYAGKSRQGWQAHEMRILIYKNSKKDFG